MDLLVRTQKYSNYLNEKISILLKEEQTDRQTEWRIDLLNQRITDKQMICFHLQKFELVNQYVFAKLSPSPSSNWAVAGSIPSFSVRQATGNNTFQV